MAASRYLEHSPARVLQQLLLDLGLGGDPEDDPVPAWPVFVSREPSSPDECLTVYDTEERRHGRTMADGAKVVHYGVQVRVRSRTYEAGRAKADAVQATLEKGVYQTNVSIEGHAYTVGNVSGAALRTLGKDVPGSKRDLFVVNGLVALAEIA